VVGVEGVLPSLCHRYRLQAIQQDRFNSGSEESHLQLVSGGRVENRAEEMGSSPGLRLAVSKDGIRRHQLVPQVAEVLAIGDGFSVGKKKLRGVWKADVEDLSLLCVHLQPYSFRFRAEPCKGALSSRRIAAQEGDVVCVSECR
jgi:hypothetical protein